MRLLSAALLGVVWLMQAGTAQGPTFRSRTDLVTVDVAVTRGGATVTGLQIADFELTDNGVAQRVELLDTATLPLDVTIVLDTSGSMQRAVEDLRHDTRAIAAMLHAGDRVRLMTFAENVRETMAFQAPGGDLPLQELAAAGSTSLFDAVAAAMIRNRDGASGGERRHLLIVLTDGVDTSSVLGLQPLADISRRTDAVVYAAVSAPSTPISPPPIPPPISPHSPLPPPPERQFQRRVWTPPPAAALRDTGPLRAAVDNTGGVWDGMRSIARAPEGVERALEWFRAAYVLRYRATGVTPGGWHELNVRIKSGEGYDVRARRGYFGA
jgi:VWFA-related protein